MSNTTRVLPDHRRRSIVLRVPLRPGERDRLEAIARELGVPMAALVRARIAHDIVDPRGVDVTSGLTFRDIP